MDLLAAALIFVGYLFLRCEGGYFPLYGENFSVLYNASGSIPSRRFPDQTEVNRSNYLYFSRDVNVGGIFAGDNLVVGAKNALYHLNLNLTLQSQVTWNIDSAVQQTCIASNPEYICQNHIRTFQRIPSSTNDLLVCGTQGDQTPQCAAVAISGGVLGTRSAATNAPDGLVSYYIDSPGFGEFIDASGTGMGNMDNRYFSAAFTTSSRNFLMSYQNVRYDSSTTPPITISQSFRTRSADNFWLRSPVTFVDYYRADYPQITTAGDNQYYFVFLRENFQLVRNRIPLEFIYSRVVRLCRNDQGSTADNYFKSFIKARIFCDREAPSDNRSVNTRDFQYNVITSMGFNSGGRYHEAGAPGRAMYGAFIASEIGPTGSAVCIYGAETSSSNGIYAAFTHDLLDYETSTTDPTLAFNANPNCGSTRADDDARYKVESSSNVAQIGESPILVLDQYTITQIVVDSQCIIRSTSTTACADQDILLLGTSVGTILKVSFATTASRQIDPVISEEIRLDDNNPIKKLKLETVSSQKVLFVTTDSKLYRVPLARCSRHDNMCSACIGNRDPYCVWNTNTQTCDVNSLASSATVSANYLQSVHNKPVFPVVSFSMEDYTVSEADMMLTVTLTMDRAASGDVMVAVTSLDGTATAGEDYTTVSNTVTIPSGQTTASFSITITNDNVLEGRNETFTLNLQGRGSVCVDTGDPATVVIQDSNGAMLSLADSAVQVGEAAGLVNLTVSSSVPASNVAINFYISTTAGTATDTLDYSGLSQQSFTFAAGSAGSQTISVPIVNDVLLENSETFTVTLALADNPGLDSVLSLGNSQTTVTIQDNDGLQFGFESASYTTVEQDSNAVLSLTVVKIGSNQIPVSISANLLSTGTATSGSDYSFSATTVVFDSSTVEQVVQVNILADTVVEGVETFGIVLTTAAPRVTALSGRGTATIYIEDNDVVVGFTNASRTVAVEEGAGSVTLTVEASGNLPQPVTVSYRTVNGVATASSDYTSVSGSLELTSMAPTGVISIPITNDVFYEPAMESFRVELTSTSGNNVQLQNNVATVNIVDDDGVTVEFSSASRNVNVNEDVGSVMLTVQFQGTSSANPVTISYNSVNGGAKAGMDFTFTSGTLQSNSGTGITVPITNDEFYEGTESFTVVLSSSNSRIQFVNNIATISITDNDDEVLAIEHVSAVMESGSYVTLTVTKTMANEIPVNFIVNTTDITAQSYSDYAPLSSVPFSFPPGSSNSMEVFQVAIVDDSVLEDSESFRVGLMSSDPRVSVSTPETTITINDNDTLVIGFEFSSYTVSEGNLLPVYIVKQGYSSMPLTVTISSVQITATLSDYSLQSQTVTFAPDVLGSFVYVNILTDSVFEGMETFNLTIQSTDRRLILRPREATITIRDNSAVSVMFDRSDYVVIEDGGDISLSVSTTPADLSTSVTVQLRIVPQSAIDGVDFSASDLNPTIVIGPESSQTNLISIPIINDNVFEMLNETFLVFMYSNDSDVMVQGMGVATVIIMDDDMLTFGFENELFTVNEGGTLNLNIVKQGSTSLPVTLTITASPSTYSSQPGTVTFAANEVEQQITVNINANVQQSANLVLSLQSSDPRVLIRRNATITIREQSDVYVSFVRNEYSVSESAGSVDLMINRTTASSVQVELLTFKQTAIDGEDYNASSLLTYTLKDPSLVDRISIPILDDKVLEMPRKTFLVVLKTSQGASVRGMDSASVSIEDDDSNTFGFAQDSYTVSEGSYVNITVQRTMGVADIPIELRLSISAQSTDTSTYPVVFLPSQQSVSVLIPTVKGKTDEKFSVTLAPGPNMSLALKLGSGGTANAEVQVLDNDGGLSTAGLSGTCSPVFSSTSFIGILVALAAVFLALVVLSVICIICIVKNKRYKTPRGGKRSGIAPYGRETSTTVLGNIHTSDGSSDGSPSTSSRSEEKSDLSKGQRGLRETDIDSSTGTSSMNHIINTNTSTSRSSKEPSDKHDLSSSSPSPTSLPPKTALQSNGNDLTLL